MYTFNPIYAVFCLIQKACYYEVLVTVQDPHSFLPAGIVSIYSPDSIAIISTEVRVLKNLTKAVDISCSSQFVLCLAVLLESINDGR